MDAAALAALLSSSTEQLVGLHSQIGHPPEALQGALDALHQALKTAVDDQIGRVQQEAHSLRTECTQLDLENEQIKTALGENPSVSPLSLQNAVGKRMMSAAGSPNSVNDAPQTDGSVPLLQRRAQLQQDQERLRATYSTREAQIDRLSAKLHNYSSILGDFVSKLNEATSGNPFRDVSLPRIAAIEAEIIRCSKEVNARSQLLQDNLLEVVQLWSELCLEPCQPAVPGEDQVFASQQQGENVSCGGSTMAFDRAVLVHLQLQPVYDHHKRFMGEFVPTEAQNASEDGASRAVDILGDTPTRASLGGLPARNADDLALPLSSTSKSSSYTLEPSESNLAQVAEKLQWLETEKRRREMLIQVLYDDLSELWAKFDVPEEEMDAFVMENRGSTLEVVEAYQAELEKMKQLKAQHMSLFISKTRERISTLWDSLFLTEEERQISFPSFYIDVMSATEYDEPLPTDEILASHEQMIDHLTEQVRTKAPVLKVIGRYKELLDEARQLDESAADGSRLLGRSNRGDPGRLLREEKMRKRVKIQKPKIEAELIKVIPAWEEDHNEPFTINGLRYLDELLEQIEGSKENGTRKRTRTPSGAQPPPTPMNAPASVRRGPLASSTTSNRGVSAATPMRPMTPSEGTIKRPRLAPPSSVSTAKTPSNRAALGAASTISRTASARAPVSGVSSRAAYGANSIQRPATSMAGRFRAESSSSQAAPSSSPSRVAGTTSSLAPKTYSMQTPASSFGYGARATATTKTVRPQRESFQPRPSLVAKVSRSNTVVGGANRGPVNETAPGRASKWGNMGPPTWSAGDTQAQTSRNVSGSSIHTDVTTVVHPVQTAIPEPAKRPRRAPSMSLEACLANLASSSSHGKARLGDAGRDDGIYSIRPISESANTDAGAGSYARVHGWKDGLRYAGASVEETDEDMAVDTEGRTATLPRSASNNWELLAQSDPDQFSHHASALAA